MLRKKKKKIWLLPKQIDNHDFLNRQQNEHTTKLPFLVVVLYVSIPLSNTHLLIECGNEHRMVHPCDLCNLIPFVRDLRFSSLGTISWLRRQWQKYLCVCCVYVCLFLFVCDFFFYHIRAKFRKHDCWRIDEWLCWSKGKFHQGNFLESWFDLSLHATWCSRWFRFVRLGIQNC